MPIVPGSFRAVTQRRRVVAGLSVIVAAIGVAVAVPSASAHVPAAAGGHRDAATVDLALGAQATATSAADGQPASNVADADARTAWCAGQWQGSVTIDLGQVQRLTGFGVTLAQTASASTASIDIATEAGRWRTVPTAKSVALERGVPSYLTPQRGTEARFARLTVSTGDGSSACVGEFRLFGRTAASRAMMRGADLSFQRQELAAGTRFTDAGNPSTPVRILAAHGGNYVRMRLWINPPAGYSDLASDLALARQVRAAGMRVYLDIHYSDFWADPQHQDTPSIWRGQDLPTLAGSVRSYTEQVMAAFARQGTPVDMVSIGNEIRNGLLWPTGQLDWSADTGWDNLATLLKAGVSGARAANPNGHRLRIMLHFDEGGNSADSDRFFSNLVSRGVPFDTIGLSYYPFWHGTLSDLRTNVDALARHFGKDIVVAETQYAWTLANGDSEGNFVWQPSQVFPGYPASPGGQLSLENDVQSILAAAPGGHGVGIFYWEPEWVPGVGWQPGNGAPNDNLTLYDFQGHTLPSIGLFEDPVAVCARFDAHSSPCTVPV
jgi:arabinogalactan endo-1,4-beta-galactosidase